MSVSPVAVLKTGLVTAVGLDAPASCAAIRAKLTHPLETRFADSGGEWLTACSVRLDEPWREGRKLAVMAAHAAQECLADIPKREWEGIPMWLCVAEKTRIGREAGLDERLHREIADRLGTRFAPQSAIVPHGRASIATALFQARQLLHETKAPYVLIVAADSLLTWPMLEAYERDHRLLTSKNTNGFIPGEAAAALLVGRPTGQSELLCVGLGFGVERATLGSGLPLKADGLVQAIRAALDEAGCALHDMDLRIADVSGEQYYFKEAALAVARIMRQRKDEFDLWHAAECTGEAGAAAGLVAVAVAEAAARKAYAPGPNFLVHASNDAGERAALVLKYAGGA